MIGSTNKVKIFCTYKTKLDLDSEKYDLTINDKALLTRKEFLEKIRGCHGILSNPRSPKFNAEALDAAGSQLKVIVVIDLLKIYSIYKFLIKGNLDIFGWL